MTRALSGYGSTHPGAPASSHRGRTLILTLVHPPELAGAKFPLEAGVTFGRSPEEGLASILHPTISRRHATLRTGLGGVLCLLDLESRNGSRVNGARSALPVPLETQSVVRMGDVLGVVDEPAAGQFADDPVLPGESPRVVAARAELARAAPDAAPLLIIGETGTGKERVAREAHRLSGRTGPYLTLNCAELSPQLIESELFGHERGAFTGAAAAKTGLFLAAHGGTLFLDEIGELPRELQPKLLRVLQEKEVRPVGSTRAVPTDTRVVAATNRDLAELAGKDEFRRDLYARLGLWELRLPPLRERRQDLLAWLNYLVRAWNEARGTECVLAFQADAAERVLLHAWPDNLRGLNRLVHRLASLSSARPVGMSALLGALPELGSIERTTAPEAPAPGAPAPDAAGTLRPSAAPATTSTLPPLERPAREEFLAVYEASGRSVRATSKHYGRDRKQIYRWLEAFGIQRETERE